MDNSAARAMMILACFLQKTISRIGYVLFGSSGILFVHALTLEGDIVPHFMAGQRRGVLLFPLDYLPVSTFVRAYTAQETNTLQFCNVLGYGPT